MKKHWKILSAISLGTFLAACGSSGEVDQKIGGGNDQTGYETPAENEKVDIINEEKVGADLQFVDGYFTFTLKNKSGEPIEFVFPSTQKYEYQIKDSLGNLIYTFSMDKMFGMQMVEQTLAPDEVYVMNLDVDIITSLQAETYTIEVWSVANDTDLRDEMEFTLEEVAHNLEGTYVGQIDSNSVEIIDANGNPKAYRLTGTTNEFITSLETNDEINYSFYKKNGQLFLTMIHATH